MKPFALARRARLWLQGVLSVFLVALVYCLAMPWAWLWLRLAKTREVGWVERGGDRPATLERLRQPF